MSEDKNPSFTVKAVINKEKTRVLFAIVDNNFVDILFFFATQSLGLVMRALMKHFGDKTPVFGCLNNFYNGLTKLCGERVDTELRWSYNSYSSLTSFYGFPSGNINNYGHVSEKEYFCYIKLFSEIGSFIVVEDLRIVADGKGYTLESLNSVGVAVEDMDGAETRTVTIGVNEIMDFLLRLFISHRPLTDIILGPSVDSELAKMKSDAGIPLHLPEKSETCYPEMMILKLMLQKSTDKLLFAESDHVFVNSLYSVLTIPFGRVYYHLGSITCPKNMNNLCNCVANLSRNRLAYVHTEKTDFPFKTLFRRGKFRITDDLSVTPLSLLSNLSLFDDLKIPLSDVKEVELQIGIDEVFSIMRASLTSSCALTDGLKISGMKNLTPKQEK